MTEKMQATYFVTVNLCGFLLNLNIPPDVEPPICAILASNAASLVISEKLFSVVF